VSCGFSERYYIMACRKRRKRESKNRVQRIAASTLAPYWAAYPAFPASALLSSMQCNAVRQAVRSISNKGKEELLFLVFFLFNHYSHATYLDNGEIMYCPFPVRCPHGGGTLQAPPCPPPRPVPRKCVVHQKNEKGKRERKRKGEDK